MELNNEVSGGENTDSGISSDGMAAIESKFNEVFGGADAAPAAEPEAPVATDDVRSGEKSEQRQRIEKQTKAEAAEELLADNLVDVDGNKPTPAGDETEKTEGDEAEEAKPNEAADAAPEVPIDDLTRYIANQNGYSDERIARIFKADPELGQEIFGRLANDYTALSRQYAQASQVAPGTPQQPAQSTVSALNQLFSPENLSAFAEANGEEMVEKFMKPLFQEIIGPVQKMQARMEIQERQLIAQEATSAYEKLSEKFSGLYGKGVELTQGHRGAREQVARLADAIRTGAQAQGIDMSVTDAINRAHLVVSAPQVQQQARREVKQQVQQRASRLTAKPTQRKTNVAGSRSEAAALEAYSRKAQELGVATE